MGQSPGPRGAGSTSVTGAGGYTQQQLEAAQNRAQVVIQQALGHTNLMEVTEAQSAAALVELERMLGSGSINQAQFNALKDGLTVLRQLHPDR